MKKTKTKLIILSTAGDENSDWIKLVRGGSSQRQEFEIHRELTKKYAGKDSAPFAFSARSTT